MESLPNLRYSESINRVIKAIYRDLSQVENPDFSLDRLSDLACYSKYHFHRLFTLHAGVSLKSYIKWLRLKRAAHQLTVQKEDTIINIALSAGFESHEAFSRAFKQACGQSPSGFRSNPDWSAWETPPHAVESQDDEHFPCGFKNDPTMLFEEVRSACSLEKTLVLYDENAYSRDLGKKHD